MIKLVVCFLAISLGFITIAHAQQEVPFIKLDALEKRLANGGDTTYVVNMWATWCEPCIVEIPYFEQLQQTYGNDPMKVILLSLDAPKNHERVVKFRDKHALRNEVFILDERNQQEYIDRVSKEWSGAVPATIFTNQAKGIRLFREQDFDFDELNRTYLSIVNP